MNYRSLLAFFNGYTLKFDSQNVSVVGFGEVITIVDDTGSSKNVDGSSNVEVRGFVIFLFGQSHSRIIGMDGLFGEFPLFEEKGERIPSRILISHFLNFNRAISQEIVKGEVVVSSFQCFIVPENFEGKHLSIIVEVLFETIIGVSSSKSDLNVFLVFFRVRWVDFCFLCFDELIEVVGGFSFRFVEGMLHVVIKLFGELIAIIDSEDSLEEFDISGNVEVPPCVGICEFSNDLRNLLSFEEDALRDATVFDFGLGDEDSVVHEIVVDFDLSDSKIFEFAFDDVFLEIGIEPQYLSFVFDPGGLNSRDGVVFGGFPVFLEAQIVDTFGELVDKMDVNVLRYILSFFLLAMV